MAESPRSTHSRLAWSMLLVGIIGQLAYAAIVYHAHVGGRNGLIIPVLAWLRYVPWAIWAVLLVQPGRRRLFLGVTAVLLGILFVFFTETLPREWTSVPYSPAAHGGVAGPVPGAIVELPELSDVDGNAFALAAYGDRPILLSVWRTWCVPCIREMPDLNGLENLDTPRGHLAVVGLNSEPADLQRKSRAQLKIRFRLVRYEETNDLLEAELFPTTFIVWRGQVIDKWSGARSDLRARVLSALDHVK